MDKAQTAYIKRIAKKVEVAKADLVLPERMLNDWQEWIIKNPTVRIDTTRPVLMPTWFGDNWKSRVERGEDIQKVAREMVSDIRARIVAAREWIATAEKFLDEQAVAKAVSK